VRILVVTQYFWPENFRINDLVSELAGRGHTVTVLTGYPNYPDGKIFAAFRDHPGRFMQYAGAEVVRVPLTARGVGSFRLILNYVSFALSASIVGSWKLRGRRFDVVFAYEPSPITVGIPAIVLRALKRAPLAFWVLDLWPETLVAVGAVRAKWLLQAIGRLVALIYNRCDLILAQSRSFVPQIERYCRDTARIRYFPSWAESVFEMDKVQRAPEVSEKPGVFSVMFAGNIGDAQDFPAILAAADLLRVNDRIRWLIVGDGRTAAWVAREVEARGLVDRVVMLGRYPVERMPSFYKHADCLLVSLKSDPIFSMTIPGKLQSYLAAGIPVIAMLDGEGADVVERSQSGLACRAGDSQGLAQAVLQLAGMTGEQRMALGENGLKLSKTEFDRRLQIGKLEKWLIELAAANDGSSQS